MNDVVDVSILLRPGVPEWPGDTPYACGWTARIADGSSVNLTALTMSPHVGTHADAPLHVSDSGAASDALPLQAFIGRAAVVDVRSADDEITLEDLERFAAESGVTLQGCERLLLRTGRTVADGQFPERWATLTPDCATALVGAGLRLLGVDAPSVDARESKALAVHHALFDGGAYNLENLDLRAARTGWHELIAPPLRIDGIDAAPVRAVLRSLATG